MLKKRKKNLPSAAEFLGDMKIPKIVKIIFKWTNVGKCARLKNIFSFFLARTAFKKFY